MATMICECGETVNGPDGHLEQAIYEHRKTHEPLTQAHWTAAHNSIQAAKEKAKKNERDTL